MILDCGAPVSLAGVSWMEQYLQEFGLTIDQMSSTACKQPFVFGPSKRYVRPTARSDLDFQLDYIDYVWKLFSNRCSSVKVQLFVISCTNRTALNIYPKPTVCINIGVKAL